MSVTQAARIFATVLFFSAISLSFAQHGGPRNSGRGGGSGQSMNSQVYNGQTVVTVSGAVSSVERITPESGLSYDVYLIVRMDEGPIDIYLGPGWYIDSADIKIEKGDTVEVKGSRVLYRGNPSIMAAEVTTAAGVLRLRDIDSGTPVWTGSKNPD